MPAHPLTDTQISILFDVGEISGPEPDARKAQDVRRLIAEGYMELVQGDGPTTYRLTGKAQRLLAERGAGLNEA